MTTELSLAELFAAADETGDKYLSPEEIKARDEELEIVYDDVKILYREQ